MTSIKKRGKYSELKRSNVDTEKVHFQNITDLPSNLILKLKKRNIHFEQDWPDNQENESILQYTPKISIPEAFNAKDSHNYEILTSTTVSHTVKSQQDETSMCCWHCCHSIPAQVFKLPIRKNSKKIFECIGFFCSPECILSYIDSDGNSFGNSWNQIEFLYEMLKIETRIKPAPRKELLKKFGGELSIEKFRENSNWNFVLPPFVPLSVQLDIAPNDDKQDNQFCLEMNLEELIEKSDTKVENKELDKKRKKKASKSSNTTLDSFFCFE